MKTSLMLFVLFLSVHSLAQQSKGQFTTATESDPKAKAILDKMRKQYQGYQSLEADFSLEIQLPEQKKEVQQGKIARLGKKYRVDMDAQSMLSDGTALWLILHRNKEVQINNVPDARTDESILSPEALFNFYDRGKFVYFLVNEATINGKVVQDIEFKPLDKHAEFSKLRMSLDKATLNVISVTSFGKDGSRYTMKVSSLSPNKTFAANYFSFDKSKYPGYRVEDLRD